MTPYEIKNISLNTVRAITVSGGAYKLLVTRIREGGTFLVL